MFWKYRLPIIGFLLITIIATVPNLAVPQATVVQRPVVHALLVIPVDDRVIEVSVKLNSSNMQKLIIPLKDDCRVRMTVMELKADNTAMVTVTEKDRQFTDEQSSKQMTGIIGSDLITAWIRDLEPLTNDTILVYYTGAGGINESGEHFLRFAGQDSIKRDELSDLLAEKQCRLKLLITDVGSSGPPVTEPLGSNTQYGKVPASPSIASIDGVRHLFLQHTGFLNLTAATEGEHAWASEASGGSLFTLALTEAINSSSDLDDDGFLSWEEVFKSTRKEAKVYFDVFYANFSERTKSDLKQKGIQSQRPKYYGELPKPR